MISLVTYCLEFVAKASLISFKELKRKMAAKKNKNLENDQNITINLVTYCLEFVAKASFISFNHGL